MVDSSSIHHVDASSLTMLEALVEVLLNQQPPIEILMASVSDSLALQVCILPQLRARLKEGFLLSYHAMVFFVSSIVPESALKLAVNLGCVTSIGVILLFSKSTWGVCPRSRVYRAV